MAPGGSDSQQNEFVSDSRLESEPEGEYQQSVRLSIHVGHEQELRETE